MLQLTLLMGVNNEIDLCQKIRTLLVLGMVVLGLSAGSLYAQDANLCPFSDDEVVLYSSPSTSAKLPAIQKVWGVMKLRAL